MAVPDFQTLMLPLLQFVSDGSERTMREATDALTAQFELTPVDAALLTPSGGQSLISNRVAWAKTHLKNAGLLENPARGRIIITDAGLRLLAENPGKVNVRLLKQYPTYREFLGPSQLPLGAQNDLATDNAQETPLEALDNAYVALRRTTVDELLNRLKNCSPSYFEVVMVRLLRAMGYGGVTGDGEVIGRPGDGGIDGIIKEDKLGLDIVCIQAKRWENVVGRPVVQAFVGSMDFVRARKGVIMTTSSFSRDAIDYVDRIEGKKVVLIDGEMLTKLMIDHNVGVTTRQVYELKEVSNDFFDEELG